MLNIPNGLDQFQIDTYKLAYSLCMKKRNEGKSITEAIDIVCESLGGMVSKDNLREFLLAEVTVTSTPSIGIVAQDIRSNKWWSELKNSHEFRPEYSRRYYDYMRQKPSWSVIDVDRINDSTDDVMNAIADPRDSGLLERIGLVFGYVQSGKTAHYISLINKAYDAGYKVIIVLTGIHNSLRSQTQARIDRCPKNRCISKTVAAKCVMAWMGYPDIVSKGLETNFVYFSEKIQTGEIPEPSVQSYTTMISQVILFNTVDKIINAAKYGGFKAQQDYYSVALLGKYYHNRIDLQEIWRTQALSDDLIGIVQEVADFVWDHFQKPVIPGINTSQWCKKEDCWTLLQARFEQSNLYVGSRDVQND